MDLPSGAKLDITLAPFASSQALFEAILEEAKGLKIDSATEIDTNLIKDLFCVGFSSKKIKAALKECLKRATYNGCHITDDIFEPEEARGDYFSVCWEVALANVLPFTKSHMQKLRPIVDQLKKGQL